jgi:hypothetical protein
MFASFMPKSSLRPAPPRDNRAVPTLPEKSFVPEIEFDRRVAYWAMTRGHPPTATVRESIFDKQVRAALDTNQDLARSLAQLASLHPNVANKIEGLSVMIADWARASLRACALRTAAPGRVSVQIEQFAGTLADRLAALPHQDVRLMIDYIGITPLTTQVVDVLRRASTEQALATQLSQTARAIRRMEGQISNGTLAEEDVFELKLRRDLFAADLRVLSRLVKGAAPARASS